MMTSQAEGPEQQLVPRIKDLQPSHLRRQHVHEDPVEDTLVCVRSSVVECRSTMISGKTVSRGKCIRQSR